jgi:HAD superfamily hydrolase (TIGR01490 family)
MHTLALFDLDETVASIDTNQAWIQFLIEAGVLPRATFEPAAHAMQARYRAAQSGVDVEFVDFFASALVACERATLDLLCARFTNEIALPSVSTAARDELRAQRDAGALVVMITATHRYLAGAIATALQVPHLIATELEYHSGHLTGRTTGLPAMREAKVVRLDQWLASDAPGGPMRRSDFAEICAYADSINDLPLLSIATQPFAVNPDRALYAHAQAAGWPVLAWMAISAPQG